MNLNYIEKNYYEILELVPGADIEEIHQAYKRSVNTYNGDNSAMYSIMTEAECKEILEKIEEAYSIIGDREKKVKYDLARGFTENTIATQKISHNDYAFTASNTTIKESAEVSKTSAQSRFTLNFQVDQNFEKDIENCPAFTGDYLKKIREYKNVTLERMSDMTKVSKTHLRHIEENIIDKLPADVYTRGFVFQYAKCLKLNPEVVSKSYMNHLKELKNSVND